MKIILFLMVSITALLCGCKNETQSATSAAIVPAETSGLSEPQLSPIVITVPADIPGLSETQKTSLAHDGVDDEMVKDLDAMAKAKNSGLLPVGDKFGPHSPLQIKVEDFEPVN
jgi:hypothetical protein